MKFKKNIFLFSCICISTFSFANADTSFQKHSAGLYITPSMFSQNIKFRLSWKTGLQYESFFSRRFFFRTGIAHSVYKSISYETGSSYDYLNDVRRLLFEFPLLAGYNIVKFKEYGNIYLSAGFLNLLIYNERKKEIHSYANYTINRENKDLRYYLLFQTSVGVLYHLNTNSIVFAEPSLMYVGNVFWGFGLGIKQIF